MKNAMKDPMFILNMALLSIMVMPARKVGIPKLKWKTREGIVLARSKTPYKVAWLAVKELK